MQYNPSTTTTLERTAYRAFTLSLESECGLTAERQIIKRTNQEWRIKDVNGTWYGDHPTLKRAALEVIGDFTDDVIETFEAQLDYERLEAERLAA